MKKIAFTMASILVATGAAFADDHTTLTTKNYVDSGLRAVYQKAQTAETKADNAASAAATNADAITNIQTTLGDGETSGLIKDVNDLKAADYLTADDIAGKADQSDLDTLSETVAGHTTAISELQTQVNAIDTSTYTGEKGVAVDNTTHKVGLSVPAAAATDGNPYVYKNGAWVPLDVEDTWDASILTGGN